MYIAKNITPKYYWDKWIESTEDDDFSRCGYCSDNRTIDTMLRKMCDARYGGCVRVNDCKDGLLVNVSRSNAHWREDYKLRKVTDKGVELLDFWLNNEGWYRGRYYYWYDEYDGKISKLEWEDVMELVFNSNTYSKKPDIMDVTDEAPLEQDYYYFDNDDDDEDDDEVI